MPKPTASTTMNLLPHKEVRYNLHCMIFRINITEVDSFIGQIGITLNTGWAEPLDPYDGSHLEASETDMQFALGWYAQPILMDGKYPTIMREKVCTL